MKRKDYWPCIPVVEGTQRSIVFTHFFRVGTRANHDAASVTKLVRMLVRRAKPGLKLKIVSAQHSLTIIGDEESLLVPARVLREILDEPVPSPQVLAAALTPVEAARALRAGYIETLDSTQQERFLRGWDRAPDPTVSLMERDLESRDASTRSAVARRLCTLIAKLWEQPESVTLSLSHPLAFDRVIAAIEKESNRDVLEDLVMALSLMCRRLLPDQRAQRIFEQALVSPDDRLRAAAVDGLSELCSHDWSKLLPLLADPSPDVRVAVCQAAWRSTRDLYSEGLRALAAPVPKATRYPRDQIAKLEAMRDDPKCRQYAENALEALAS